MRKRLAFTTLALATAVTACMAVPATATSPDPVRQGLETLLRSDGAPGVLASVQDPDGRTRTYVAGEGDRDAHTPVPREGQVRIGSVTKTFTAVVVLQLAGEGKIRLDDPVEAYLPNLVRGKGIDGRQITVRQLLQHTSGLPEYEDDVTKDILERRYLSPRDALDVALGHEAVFTPGTKYGYSSTNYLVAGLIVQKVTGRPFTEEIDKRVIARIGLRHTYFPAPGETIIRERHPQGYRQDQPGAPLHNVTDIDPSASWVAGEMVSTNSDLNDFFSELLKGEGNLLLDKAQLAQMRTTVPMGKDGYNAGLGIISTPLKCDDNPDHDRVAWGHSGAIPGYGTWAAATDDGHAASVTMTLEPKTNEAVTHLENAVNAALCR